MHHGLGSIAIANGKFSNSKTMRQAISRDKKQNWSDIASNKGMEIKQCSSPDVPALARTIMWPVSQSILYDCSIDILWNCAHVFNKSCLNWSGYTSSLKTNNHPLAKVSYNYASSDKSTCNKYNSVIFTSVICYWSK